MTHHSEALIVTNTVMKQSKNLAGDLKPGHKKLINADNSYFCCINLFLIFCSLQVFLNLTVTIDSLSLTAVDSCKSFISLP